MNIKNITQSHSFRGILIGIGIVVAVLIIFQVGVSVGIRKATFGHRLGDNFERNFKDPRLGKFGFRNDSIGMNMLSGHGAVGKIVSIELPLVVVAGPDALEKTIVITKDTEIRQFRNVITKEDLVVGSYVVVLGTPNDVGQIDAKLVRLVPAPKNNL